jgi:dihydrofolate synthase/folylpolyglutamate synthase
MNENFRPGPRVLIFAVARDKDVAGLLRQLLPEFNQVILTRFVTNPRGLPVAELSALASRLVQELSLANVVLHAEPTPPSAWEKWLRISAADSLLCITGSFFLAAELTSQLPRRVN